MPDMRASFLQTVARPLEAYTQIYSYLCVFELRTADCTRGTKQRNRNDDAPTHRSGDLTGTPVERRGHERFADRRGIR